MPVRSIPLLGTETIELIVSGACTSTSIDVVTRIASNNDVEIDDCLTDRALAVI